VREHPGRGNQEVSPGCAPTLTAQDLAFAAFVREAAMRDKSYRVSPVGEEVGRFLRAIRWADAAENTLLAYETALRLLALDHAHLSLDEITTDLVHEFLDRHWSEAAPGTRRARLACVKSFFGWAVDNGRCASNPAAPIKPPKRRAPERQAYPR
jgi:site-specific recombinase XerC